MKKLLWRPSKLSWHIHVVISLIAILLLISVEVFKNDNKRLYFKEKIYAAELMKKAFTVLKEYRLKNNLKIDEQIDPTKSGLMGLRTSEVTSVKGEYTSKRATLNPNWAAVLVEMFKKAGVEKGSYICAGFSGSFPAMNISILAAAKALDLKVIIISSAAASSWGANFPSLLWIDMENVLYENNLFSFKSVAASLGGINDNATGMSEDAKNKIKSTIEKYKLEFIAEDDIKKNVDLRMDIFSKYIGSKLSKKPNSSTLSSLNISGIIFLIAVMGLDGY